MNNNEYRLGLVNNYLDNINLSDEILSYFHNRTILVTGGAGAIGSNLVIALSKLALGTSILLIMGIIMEN